MKLNVIFKSGQMITCAVKLENFDDEVFCSFIYASNFVEERKELWRDIKSHQESSLFSGKSWICFGDFNEILKVEEHSIPQVTPGMRDFQETVRHCSFLDMV